MDMVAISHFLQLLIEAVITAALPIVIHRSVMFLEARAKSIWSSIDSEKRWLIKEAVRTAVLAAEQSGLSNELMATGKAKKDYALRMAQNYLTEFGIEIDLSVLDSMIESIVWEELKKDLPKDLTEPTTS